MTFGVGNRIRSRRMELGWTQDQLCSKVNLSKSFISEVENNKRNLSAANLLDIAKVLGLSTDFLMTGETGTQTPTLSLDIPQSLAKFASAENLSLRQTMMLLDMQKQILAHRRSKKAESLEIVDWAKFYNATKDFLETE